MARDAESLIAMTAFSVKSISTVLCVALGSRLSKLQAVYLFAAVTIMSSVSSSIFANEIEELAEQTCGTCHGEAGVSTKPDIPSIGGFSDIAILDLLETYKLQLREARRIRLDDGTETDMVEVIDSRTAEELENIAIYYSEQPWVPINQSFDREMAAEGSKIHKRKCNKCHIEGGSVPEADHALLAGQWRDYLEGEIKNFSDGSRQMSAKMKKQFDTLNEDAKKALIEFYVSAGNF